MYLEENPAELQVLFSLVVEEPSGWSGFIRLHISTHQLVFFRLLLLTR